MKKDYEILLIEDNIDDVELSLMALREGGIDYKIKVLRDGMEALEYLFAPDGKTDKLQRMPVLILLDLKLPKVDGFQVLKRIKSHPEAKVIPVVIMTSSDEGRDRERSYRMGTNSYIKKPVDFDQFVGALRQISAYWLDLNEPPLAN